MILSREKGTCDNPFKISHQNQEGLLKPIHKKTLKYLPGLFRYICTANKLTTKPLNYLTIHIR